MATPNTPTFVDVDWLVAHQDDLNVVMVAPFLVNTLDPTTFRGTARPTSGREGSCRRSTCSSASCTPTPEPPSPTIRSGTPLPTPVPWRRAGVITYCGSGIAATYAAFNLARPGRDDVAVYDGSLTKWAADPKLPLVTADWSRRLSGPRPGRYTGPHELALAGASGSFLWFACSGRDPRVLLACSDVAHTVAEQVAHVLLAPPQRAWNSLASACLRGTPLAHSRLLRRPALRGGSRRLSDLRGSPREVRSSSASAIRQSGCGVIAPARRVMPALPHRGSARSPRNLSSVA